jgi:hypothetical protein
MALTGMMVLTAFSFCEPIKDGSVTAAKTKAIKSPSGTVAVSHQQKPPPAAAPVKTAAKRGAPADTLVITARLTEIPGKFAPNDLYNYVYIMKYHVLKVEKGSYTGQEILIGHYNPLVPRKRIRDKMTGNAAGDVTQFRMGDVHRLVLIQPIERVWKDAVEDEYFDSDLDKYYALRVDIAQ